MSLTVALTGHRPDKLGLGYDPNTWMAVIQKFKTEYVIPTAAEHGGLTVISGMALGFDMIGAAATVMAYDEGHAVRLVAAVPFVGQESHWINQRAVRWYHKLLARASEVTVVSEGGYAAAKLQRRNEWMMDRAFTQFGRCVACFNGTSGGTANAVHYATRIGLPFDHVFITLFPHLVAQPQDNDPPPAAPAIIDARPRKRKQRAA